MKAIEDSWLSYRRALIERLRVPAWVAVSLTLIDGQLTSTIALRGLAVSAGFALVSLAVSVHYFRHTMT